MQKTDLQGVEYEMRIEYFEFSDKGDREINEDSVVALEKEGNYGFAVCDGLGGHGQGEIASGIATSTFVDMFYRSEDLVNLIGEATECAQKYIGKRQAEEHKPHELKTTLAALVIDENIAYVGHVGDTRLYYFQKNKLKWRTLDHSVPQMLALAGDIKEKDIRRHADRNMLLKVIGTEWDEPQYELAPPVELKSNAAFLLCTDGFWDFIDEKAMQKTLKKSKTAKEWCESMVEIVKANGKGNDMDNYSAITVFCR